MCRFGKHVNAVSNIGYDSNMPWSLYQKHQVSGVASSLTGHRKQPFHVESGKASPLLRLDSVGEISSDSEQSVLSQHTTMAYMDQDPQLTNMEATEKYPFSHAAENQLQWLRYGNQFPQAYKLGFSPYIQANAMQLHNFAMPAWETAPQAQVYNQPRFSYQRVGENFTLYQAIPRPILQGFCQPVYRDHGNAAKAFPLFPGISNGQINIKHDYSKSRMNPNAKPFTPQSMRNSASTVKNNQPGLAVSETRSDAMKGVHGNVPSVHTDVECGQVIQKCLADKSTAVASVAQEPASALAAAETDLLALNPSMGCETASNKQELDNKESVLTGAETYENVTSAGNETCESTVTDSECENDCQEKDCKPGMSSNQRDIDGKREGVSFTTVVTLSSPASSSQNDQNQINLGRNTYILSRPRLKKKGKSVQDRKRRKKKSGEATVSSSENAKDAQEKTDSSINSIAFIVGSVSSEEDSDGDMTHNSIVISPLQCDTDSAEDSDWDEVDGIASAADFFTDQMCELLQPFMMSVLTLPTTSSIPKSASAPHLLSQSLEAVNRKWSEIYNSPQSDDDNSKSSGANRKKVHFAREESVNQPFKTIHPVEEYCRRGPWEQYAADRYRFKSRIADIQTVINPILTSSHREKIFADRYSDVS